ncbi:MAG: TetR/AcrR family transcriptional regulator [Ruminococcaceae bacterium]|nr:TetR/AcrR family transcriptional regulator [Oscillospiraceae bacterium]
MPPKEKLTKEEIVRCAFTLLRESGYDSLNARTLAKRLGCSTMPLFRHFSGMKEIREVAVARAIERYSDYIRQGLAEPIPFKGVGRAYIRFAKDEPQLFRLFFMTPPGTVEGIPTVDPMLAQVLPAVQRAMGSSTETPEKMLYAMWIFVHGIASMIVTGMIEYDEETIGAMSSEVFAGLKEQWSKKEEKNV